MTFSDKNISVLYVDEAIAFGGSLTVIGNLIDALDKDRFKAIVVGEIDIVMLENYIKGDSSLYSIPRLYNYAQWFKTVEIINKIPVHMIRKVINYLMSMVRISLNSIYLVRLLRVIIKERIDIIHVNNGMNNLAPIIASILLRRNFIVHFHGIENPGFIQRLFIKQVPKFLAISKYMNSCLIKNGIPENKLVVIPNPVYPEAVAYNDVIALRKQYGITKNDRIVGIVGRIIRWKGHIEFLKAAKIALKTIPELKLLIVGDYSDGDRAYQDLINRIVENGHFGDRVIFTGYTKNVAAHYNLMDVCVHASIVPEPFGLVITEAMSHEVPVIASDRGAPSEIINDGENGYLIDPESTELFAKRIIELLTNEELRRKIAAKGKEHALQDYRLDLYAREIEQIYIDVCMK